MRIDRVKFIAELARRDIKAKDFADMAGVSRVTVSSIREEMENEGFTMVPCAQGAKTLSLPMQMLGADLQAKKINYNNHPILKWCLTNTGVQADRNGNIVPIKNQSAKQRIDGTASLLDAYVGLFEHYNEFTNVI